MRNTSVSQSARWATRLVGLLRLASATLTAVALLTLGQAWDHGLSGLTISPSLWLTTGMAIAAAAACAGAEIMLGGMAARAEERRLRGNLLSAHFRKLLRPAPQSGQRDGRPTGTPAQLVTVLTDNVERMTEYRQVYLGATLAAMAIPLMTCGFLIAMDPVMGLGILAAFPLVPLVVIGFLRLFRKVSSASRRERGRLTVHYLDALRNLIPIRLLGAGQRIEQQLRQRGESNRRAIMRLLAGNQLVIIILDGAFSLFLVCWSVHLIGTRLEAGSITAAEAISAVLLLTLMLEPLAQVAGFFYIGMGGMASQRAVTAHLAAEPPVQRSEISTSSSSDAAICLRDVHHDYGRGAVLDGLQLTIPHGSKVAILGPSGAGKSTLLSLLRGTTALQHGTIHMAGQDLRALEPEAVCQLSATVAQSTWLFTGTVADNLRIANPQASDAELWAALTRAHIADEIARMPLGLDSDVGERGQLISGGQAQRISLARAFLSNRKILLLDEPTSQVDVASEAAIIAALSEIDADWTVVIVTHRRSLLQVVDAAYELIDGQLRTLSMKAYA